MSGKWQTCDKCYGHGSYYVTKEGHKISIHSLKGKLKDSEKVKCEVCNGAGAYRKDSDG